MVVEKNYNFRYDNFNQLREVVTPDGKIATYTYNGDGLRASKNVDGDITNFTWDGQDVILETDGNGIVKAKNFFGLDLVSRQTADDIYYYLFNGHGDVTSLVNDLGEVVKDYNYDPFGKEIKDKIPLIPGKTAVSLWMNEVEKIDNPFRYAGEYLDEETGNYYLRARYYDPQIQRFISEDSYAKNPGWQEHVYGYVNYNPVNFIDPSGHAVTTWDRENLSNSQLRDIQRATDAWNAAYKAGDKQGMAKAHADAEAVRNKERNKDVEVGTNNGNTVTKGTGKTLSVKKGINKAFQFLDDVGTVIMMNDPLPGPYDNAFGLLISKIGKGGKYLTKIDDVAGGMGKGASSSIKSIDNILEGATPGRVTKGKAIQFEKSGGFNQAMDDFKSMGVTDVKDIPGGKVGKLPDGRTVNVRQKSSDGRPTLEIYDGKSSKKIRYGD